MADILLIDDDVTLRAVMARVLVQEGHRVLEAGDGSEGLELLAQHPVQLVITDIVMPGKEGIETIQELQEAHPEIKILAVSGAGRTGPDERLLDAELFGAHASLAKPFTMEKLCQTVERLTRPEA